MHRSRFSALTFFATIAIAALLTSSACASTLGSAEERFAVAHDGCELHYPRGSHPTGGPFEGDLTPETVVKDFLAVADDAGVERFALTGFSFSANYALQLATHTDRVAAMAIGGWPPLSAPYKETLAVVRQMLESDYLAGSNRAFIDSIRVYYEAVIAEWDEEAEVAEFDMPRMVYVGDQDIGAPDTMGEPVALAEPILRRKDDLEQQGWNVVILEGRTHDISWNEHVATVREFLDELSW